MICCFTNFHERESFNDLAHHFDNEINYAIYRGCTLFISGKKYPEDKIFEERVNAAARKFKPGFIRFIGLSASDDELKNLFINIAEWEIHSYE